MAPQLFRPACLFFFENQPFDHDIQLGEKQK
jgi:hypothetical protein